MKKLYIQTHGCQMNVYDSTKMAAVLQASHGLSETKSPEEADVLLLNTCSIREKAKEQVFSDLGRFKQLKEKNPHLIIGVGGCVASQEGEAILKRAPYVDLIFGPQTLHRVGEMLRAKETAIKPIVDITFPEIEKFDCLPAPKADGVSAFVTIMEGCSKYCSYCIVPYTRGKEISRPLDDVLAEVMALTEQGVTEITLLGQNVNDYQGETFDGKVADLASLIEYIAALDSISRIRFTTSHPSAFKERLIQAYANTPKLVNHLHLPVQSGSDRILAAMKRNYTALQFKSKIKKLRAIRPEISISSDFIVGFPGETNEDFEATLRLVEEVGFDTSFSFIYSKRPGTPAYTLEDNVSEAEKKERLHRLQETLNRTSLAVGRRMVGRKEPILVQGVANKTPGYLFGKTENNRSFTFKGDQALIGKMVWVHIEDAQSYSIQGTVET